MSSLVLCVSDRQADKWTSLSHLAFFCYGCKDPNVANFTIEHVPLTDQEPTSKGEYQKPGIRRAGDIGLSDDAISTRSRASTLGGGEMQDGLVDIDLEKNHRNVTVYQMEVHSPGNRASIPHGFI